MRKSMFHLVALSLLVPFLFFGCGGSDGASAPTTGSIAGSVTDAVKLDALSGVTVTAKDSGGVTLATATTDATGAYTLTSVPLGTVTVTFTKTDYTPPGGLVVGVLGGRTVTINAAMSEAATGKPSVAITGYNNGLYTTDDFGYGGTCALAASATDPNDNAASLTYTWSNATAPVMGSVTGSGTSGTVTFPTMAVAMASRIDTANGNAYISGYNYLDNTVGRFGILPILPDTRGAVSAKVTVSDSRGQTASVSISLNAASVLTGARNVAIGTRVYMNRGDDNAANLWTLAAKPTGSAAALDNTTIRTPSFVADLPGAYTLTTTGGKSITINAGNWVGIITGGTDTTIAVDTACTGCHNDITAINEFTPWKGTAHATIFTLGINGGDGTSGASCMVCHTVGFDRGTANNGADDLIVSTGWVFPATRQAGNWLSMLTNYPSVARMMNIQCENCHGPQNSGAHGSTGPIDNTNEFASDRISYSAELCATCHASGAGHNLYSEWATQNPDSTVIKGHSYRSRPQSLGQGASRTSCGRCHSAQGYTIYLDQLAAGNVGPINNLQVAKQAPWTSVTAANVEPITCQACHDPHDATNPNQLRIYNNVALLPAGFGVSGFGKGAICTTCHNTRNGVNVDNTAPFLHEDTDVASGKNPLTSTSTGHESAQSDVFAGRNAYFMGTSLPMISKHAAVEDTCVGCHMALNPKTHMSHGSAAVDTHRFRIEAADRATLCANCHSASVDGEAIIAATEASLAALQSKMGADMMKKLATLGTTSVNTGTDNVAANLITVAAYNGSGTSFALTYSGKTVNVNLNSFKYTSDNTIIFPTSSSMMKACWNYVLIEVDATGGIHNPSFVQAVLNNTRGADLTVGSN